MRLLIDTLNFSWHCNLMCDDPENFHSFAKAFLILSMKYWKEANYEEIIYAMDKGSFRYGIYPQYKGKRIEKRQKDAEQGVKKPTFKIEHVHKMKELLEAVNIPFIFKENYEADDIIASLVTQKHQEDPKYKQVILSTDADYEQLVTAPSIYLCKYRHGYMNYEQVKKKYEGRTGDDILDLKCMMGDDSDNIIGIKGVALKTAIKLLQGHKDIDSLNEYFIKNTEHRFAPIWDYDRMLLNKTVMRMVKDLELNYEKQPLKINKNAEEIFEEYDLGFLLRNISNFYFSKGKNIKW